MESSWWFSVWLASQIGVSEGLGESGFTGIASVSQESIDIVMLGYMGIPHFQTNPISHVSVPDFVSESWQESACSFVFLLGSLEGR